MPVCITVYVCLLLVDSKSTHTPVLTLNYTKNDKGKALVAQTTIFSGVLMHLKNHLDDIAEALKKVN